MNAGGGLIEALREAPDTIGPWTVCALKRIDRLYIEQEANR
jgi:hypothetical protein